MDRPSALRALLCLAVVVALPVAATAQIPPSSLRVVARGTITAAATVTVSEIDGTWRHEGPLDASHPVLHVAAVPVGAHELRVSLGAGREVSTVVILGGSQLATIVVAMPGDSTSAPSVVSQRTASMGEGPRFDRQVLTLLPAGDDLWTMAETATPFVIADRLDTGGLGTGRSALVGSRGESWALTNVDMAGAVVRTPLPTGQLAAAPPMVGAETVAMISGLAPAEIETPGVTVAWSPRRPGSRWAGGVEVATTTPGMVGENPNRLAPSSQRVEDWREVSAFGGGPLSDRTGLFAAVRTASVSMLELEQPSTLEATSTSLFAHVVARPAPADQWRIVGSLERGLSPFDGRRQFADPRVDERSSSVRLGVTWDHASRSGQRRSLAVSVQQNGWRPQVSPTVQGGVVDRVLHGVVPQPAADVAHQQVDGRFDWGVVVGRGRRATHDVRAGVALRRSRLATDFVALPDVAEAVAGLPARLWEPVAPSAGSLRRMTEVGWYLADRLALGADITADVGVRGDLVRGGADGAASGIRWQTISPRVSFHWQIGRLALVGGAGRYAGGHPLAFLGYGDPGEATWNVYRWVDDADGIAAEQERGALVARAGPGAGVGAIDPDLRVPRTTEWVVGGDVQLSRYSTLRGSIVIRRQTNLVGVTNLGLGPDDYRVSFVPDINADEGSPADDQLLPIYERLPSSFGRDALWLTNPEADPIRHDGIELTYELRSPRWMMLFGATAYRTLGRGGLLGYGPLENDPLVLGDRYWNPNALKDDVGRLFFDRAYVGKWVIAYAAPGDVTLGAVVRYQDGQPFTRHVVAADLAGGPEFTHAYPMGRTRFTYTATLDTRIEKTFRLGPQGTVAVRLDAFNLTNHANELAENVLTGPSFRESTITQPPRTFRVGLRVGF